MGKKLHLGCGNDYKQGFTNVDCLSGVADVVANLDERWPFEDGSVDYIYSSHCFEHLKNIGHTLCECHRVLKRGGVVEFYVPYANSTMAYQDPTHKTFWEPETIQYFNTDKKHVIPQYFGKCWFKIHTAKLLTGLHTDGSANGRELSWRYKLRSLIPCRPVLKHFIRNMYDEIHVVMEKPANV
jgi:SAM-dependent methyltransferase